MSCDGWGVQCELKNLSCGVRSTGKYVGKDNNVSGNACEEGLMLQIHNPSHTDPSRIGFLAGALSGFIVFVALVFVVPAMPLMFHVFVGLLVTLAIGTLVTRRIANTRTLRDISDLEARRQMLRQENDRKIQAMNFAKSD